MHKCRRGGSSTGLEKLAQTKTPDPFLVMWYAPSYDKTVEQYIILS